MSLDLSQILEPLLKETLERIEKVLKLDELSPLDPPPICLLIWLHIPELEFILCYRDNLKSLLVSKNNLP